METRISIPWNAKRGHCAFCGKKLRDGRRICPTCLDLGRRLGEETPNELSQAAWEARQMNLAVGHPDEDEEYWAYMAAQEVGV